MCNKNTFVRFIINRQNIPKYLLQKQQLYDIITPTVSMPSIRLGVYALVAHIHSGIVERQLNNAVGAVFMSAPIRPIFFCCHHYSTMRDILSSVSRNFYFLFTGACFFTWSAVSAKLKL